VRLFSLVNHVFKKGDTDAYCIPVPGLGVPGLRVGGLSLCMDLDPGQTGGGFSIARGVSVELFVQISVPLLAAIKAPLGNIRASWLCPNIPLIVGCVVGAAVLLLGFGYYRFRQRLPAQVCSGGAYAFADA
jgi:hypothetical protein